MPRLFVILTPADHAKLATDAAKAKLTISEWVRKRCGLEPARPRGRAKKLIPAACSNRYA